MHLHTYNEISKADKHACVIKTEQTYGRSRNIHTFESHHLSYHRFCLQSITEFDKKDSKKSAVLSFYLIEFKSLTAVIVRSAMLLGRTLLLT